MRHACRFAAQHKYRMYTKMVQLNTNYDDYILKLDGAPPVPIFTGMHEYFSVVFFNSTGSDVLLKETTTFSLGHPFVGSNTTRFLSLGIR
jgi:hypothetical protein